MTINSIEALVSVLRDVNIESVQIKKSPYLQDHSKELTIWVSPKTLNLITANVKQKMRREVENSLQNTGRIQSSTESW